MYLHAEYKVCQIVPFIMIQCIVGLTKGLQHIASLCVWGGGGEGGGH